VFRTPAPGAAGGADRYRPPLVFLHRFISDFPSLEVICCCGGFYVTNIDQLFFKFLKLAMSPEKELSPSSRKNRKVVEAGIAAD
jgi:hypothetical protein